MTITPLLIICALSFPQTNKAPQKHRRVVRKAVITLPQPITVTIAVTPEEILMEGKSVCTTEEILSLSDRDFILHYSLKSQHPILAKVDKAFNSEKAKISAEGGYAGTAILQIDRMTYMHVVHNIMKCCGRNSFGDLKFAVLSRDE